MSELVPGRRPLEVVEAAWASAEVLAAEVVAKARAEVDDDAATATQRPENDRLVSGGDAALDWAAGAEREAFEAAAMRHGLGGDEEGGENEAPADAVGGMWRELARDAAQRLLRLNEEGTKVESAWQAEKAQFLQLKAEVQEELKRELKQAAERRRQSMSPDAHANDGLGDADDDQLQAVMAELQPKLRRAQAKARNLRRERAALEGEYDKRQEAVQELERKVRLLREVL